MRLIIQSDPDGKPLRARARFTWEELKALYQLSDPSREDDEVIDLPFEAESEYQLIIGLEGKINKWDNNATMFSLEEIAKRS